MYGYNLKGKVVSIGLMAMFLVLAFVVTEMMYKLGTGMVALLLFKDVLSTFTCQFYTTNKGLFKKDLFGEQELCNWYDLEFVTITKKNKEWVALVSKDKISYLKKNIANKDALVKEIVLAAKGNKQLSVHDTINEKYHLKLKLNDDGQIRS